MVLKLSRYEIIWLKSAHKQLEKLPKKDQLKIIHHTTVLNEDNAITDLKKLKGSKSFYRIRVGDYRIIFEVNTTEKLIVIAYVGHRKDIYHSLEAIQH